MQTVRDLVAVQRTPPGLRLWLGGGLVCLSPYQPPSYPLQSPMLRLGKLFRRPLWPVSVRRTLSCPTKTPAIPAALS